MIVAKNPPSGSTFIWNFRVSLQTITESQLKYLLAKYPTHFGHSEPSIRFDFYLKFPGLASDDHREPPEVPVGAQPGGADERVPHPGGRGRPRHGSVHLRLAADPKPARRPDPVYHPVHVDKPPVPTLRGASGGPALDQDGSQGPPLSSPGRAARLRASRVQASSAVGAVAHEYESRVGGQGVSADTGACACAG